MIINPGGGAGGGLTAVNVSAGSTSNNLSAVTFDNAGGVTFGLAGSVVTASAPAAAASPINFSAGTTSNNLSAVVFNDGNNVSFGLNGSTITGSIQRGIDQIDAGVGGLAAQVITFGDANGVSFKVSNFSIVGSVQTNYAGVGETVGTVAGTDLGLTVNTDLIVPHWASNRAYGDPTHQWPPFAEMAFFYLNREWRQTQAPHTDRAHWPDGFSCHFEATWGYGLRPDLATRNQDYQQFALKNYKEVATDIIGSIKAIK